MSTAQGVEPSAPDESMRERFAAVLADLIETDERVFALFTDISWGQISDAAERFPDRVVNLGIMEQTALSAAAGVALEGGIPVVHSITPFIVHRPYEQIRDDFVYQGLGGNIVSIGASYDYASDGYTHNAPDDVGALLALAGVEIVTPGTPAELEALFREFYADGAPTYVRLAGQRNAEDRPVRFGRLHVVRQVSQGPVVLAFGPTLDRTLAATEGLPVSVAYVTTVAPFDADGLSALAGSAPVVLLVEPWFTGTMVAAVVAAVRPLAVRVESVGVPRAVIRGYGQPEDHDRAYGLTPEGIRTAVLRLLEG